MENKNNFAILALVAIVAVIGVVGLMMSGITTKTNSISNYAANENVGGYAIAKPQFPWDNKLTTYDDKDYSNLGGNAVARLSSKDIVSTISKNPSFMDAKSALTTLEASGMDTAGLAYLPAWKDCWAISAPELSDDDYDAALDDCERLNMMMTISWLLN